MRQLTGVYMTVLPLPKNRFGVFQELRDCAAVARKGRSQRNFVFQDVHHRGTVGHKGCTES
jgi:hypothetical protein